MTKLVGLELQCDWVVQHCLWPPTWFHIFTHFQSISKWNGARATNTTNTICQQLVADNTVVALCSTSHQPMWLWVRPTETGAEDLTYLPTSQPTNLSLSCNQARLRHNWSNFLSNLYWGTRGSDLYTNHPVGKIWCLQPGITGVQFVQILDTTWTEAQLVAFSQKQRTSICSKVIQVICIIKGSLHGIKPPWAG